MMATKVFISYRREDAAGHAGRVHDRLAKEFGANLLFMDVDGIPLGVNFVEALHEEVAKCGVLLAVIGPHWLKVRDKDGKRRLDNPNDFVRVEIAAALQRNIPVIPILLDGAKVPKANQLPKDLEELSIRNGLDVRHASFHSDIDKLVRNLKRSAEAETEERRRDEERRRLEEEGRPAAKEAQRQKRSEQEPQQPVKPAETQSGGAATAPERPATRSEEAAALRRPRGVPFGSQYSPSRRQWRDREGHLYEADGTPVRQ
jgi:hypothetical protein